LVLVEYQGELVTLESLLHILLHGVGLPVFAASLEPRYTKKRFLHISAFFTSLTVLPLILPLAWLTH
jgi:hypothetical protein